MRRALFAREFRSALVPNLVTVGAILGTLMVIERLFGQRTGGVEELRGLIDVVMLICLVLSGLISGERCFPAELKESRILFLSSLPIPRTWAWLTIVSARLLAALISLVFVVMLRRPLLKGAALIRPDIGFIAALVLVAYLLFFSAGTQFALLFRRTLFSYAAGFLLLAILLLESLLSNSYSLATPKLVSLSTVPRIMFDSLPPLQFLAVFVSVLLCSSLLLSWRFFVRGEIGNPKQRIINQLLFGITTTAYLGFVFYVAASPRLASVGSAWGSPMDSNQFFIQGRPLSHGVSPDGRYLFVFETTERRPFLIRVSTVENRTGRITGRSVYGGASWGYWSGQGNVLNLLVLNNSPLDRWGYLIPGTVDWIRLSPEAREISKRRLKGVEQVETFAGGRALVVLRDSGWGRIVLLNGSDGQSTEVMRAPLDGEVLVRGDGTAGLVYFDNIIQPRRAWVIDSLAHEIRIPNSILKATYVLSGEVRGFSSEVQTALLRRFGQPLGERGEPIRGSFLLPDPNRVFHIKPEVTGLYFLEEKAPDSRALWVRSTAPEGRWERLPDIDPDLSRLMEGPLRGKTWLGDFIDFASGIGAFLYADDDAHRFFVYDPQLGSALQVKGCAPRDKAFLNVDRVPGFRSTLIRLTCAEQVSPFQGQTHFFEHLPGSREVRAIKTIIARPMPAPLHLYFNERGLGVWQSFNQASLNQEIWRSSPGMEDLRLWPPAEEAETSR